MTNIQNIIKKAYSEVQQSDQAPNKESSNSSNAASLDNMLQFERNFNSLFPTIVWFLEHDPFTNIAMNLDVNFWKVKQDNLISSEETDTDILNSIKQKDGNTFQNSEIHLLFYEKIAKSELSSNELLLTMEHPPKISSMSDCLLKNINQSNLDNLAYEVEIQLISGDFTAQFVSVEQYEQLMFVLGQKQQNAPGRSCKEVLTLFNEFPTNTTHNFKDMLHRLQFPYIYDDKKNLPENRRDFQDFFSCLTNIRCAVVEGGHRCKAASRTLLGYQMGNSIPLARFEIDIPDNSTLFKNNSTQVYYCHDDERKLDGAVLKYLQGISKSIGEHKKLIVPPTWHTFFDQVLVDIKDHEELQKALFPTEAEFFDEEVHYRSINHKMVRSNLIKKYLHQILTKAIFKYSPCKELLDGFEGKHKPTYQDWEKDTNKWLSLSAEPFQNVSKYCFQQFNIEVPPAHEFISADTINRNRPIYFIPSGFCKSANKPQEIQDVEQSQSTCHLCISLHIVYK